MSPEPTRDAAPAARPDLWLFVEARAHERRVWARDNLPSGELRSPPDGRPFWVDVNGRPVIEPRDEVLDDVAAVSAILEVHTGDSRSCVGCGLDYIGDWVIDDQDRCPVLRALAWRWHRHPSWQARWEPDGVRPMLDAP